MNFGELFRTAFTLTWKYKWMWVLGFLLSPQLLGESFVRVDLPNLDNLFSEQMLKLLLLGGIVGVAMFASSILIGPAFILATLRSRANQEVVAASCIGDGLRYFWRWLTLLLIWIAISLAVLVMLVAPCAIAFAASTILGVVIALFFLPIALVAMIVITVISQISFRSLIFENLTAVDAVVRGYDLFKQKLWASIGLLIVSGLIAFAVIMPLSFAVMIPQQVLTLFGSESFLAGLVKYGFATVLSIPIVGYMNAWSSNLWTIACQTWFVDTGPGATQTPVNNESS